MEIRRFAFSQKSKRLSLALVCSATLLSGCSANQHPSENYPSTTAAPPVAPVPSSLIPTLSPTPIVTQKPTKLTPTSHPETSVDPTNPTTGYSTVFTEKSPSEGVFKTTVELGNGYRKIATISLKCATATVDGKEISGIPFSGMTTEDKNGTETYPVHGFPETPDWMNPCDENNTINESAKTKPNTNAAFFGTVALSNKAYDWIISFTQ